MPRGDGTGPDGMGPMTGRGMGFCAGYDAPGFINNAGVGRRANFFGGRGRGRGWRNQYYATGRTAWMRDNFYNNEPLISKEDEITSLKREQENLRNTISRIDARLGELQGDRENEA